MSRLSQTTHHGAIALVHHWTIGLATLAGFLAFFADLAGVGPIVNRDLGGAVGTGLVTGIVLAVLLSLVIPLGLFVWLYLLAPPLRLPRRFVRRVSEGMRQRRSDARRRDERRAYDKAAPERDRADTQRHEAQRKRDDARAAALLSYSFYAAKLGERFSRAMFDQYVKEYMGDAHPPEIVERRGKELIAIFERHLTDVEPPRKATTIAALTKWYEETKAQIQALPLDDAVKEIRLIDLERRFDELLARHLEGTEP